MSEWIPVEKELPEEKLNPVTCDYCMYLCTIEFKALGKDVRCYKFGNGHWWHGCSMMDEYVTAWMPLPEPYKASPTGAESEGGTQHNIYECSCGYGWDRSKAVRHHYCPNCGKKVEGGTQHDTVK